MVQAVMRSDDWSFLPTYQWFSFREPQHETTPHIYNVLRIKLKWEVHEMLFNLIRFSDVIRFFHWILLLVILIIDDLTNHPLSCVTLPFPVWPIWLLDSSLTVPCPNIPDPVPTCNLFYLTHFVEIIPSIRARKVKGKKGTRAVVRDNKENNLFY